MSDHDNIRGVIGDSVFFSMLERDVIEDLRAKPGLGIESIQRLKRDIPSPSPLGPPILPMSSRLIIIEDPSADALKRACAACEKYHDLHCVLEWEDDTYDRRSKLTKELVEDGRVVKVIGYIQGHEKQRFSKVVGMICEAEGITLSEDAVRALFELAPRTKRATTVEKDGKKQRRDRLVVNLQRTRGELIKAQCFAGIGEIVGEDDIRGVVSDNEETDVWSLIDAMSNGDHQKVIESLDGCVTDIGSANEVMGLIRSQVMLISRVRGIVDSMSDPNVELQDVMSRLSFSRTKYDAWDATADPRDRVAPNWYRVQRILDLRGTNMWDNSESAMSACIDAYGDLHGYLSTDWRSVMTMLCLRLCSPGCETMSFPR